MDWTGLFVPTHPLGELAFRAASMYLAILVVLRGVLKREAGTVGKADLLMMVLIAEAAQNAIAPNDLSIAEGLVLVTTIILVNFTLDWLGRRVPAFGRFMHPDPLPLVADGRLIRPNLRKEAITEAELMTEAREHGVDDLAQIDRAYIEGDGRITILKRGRNTETEAPARPGPV